MNRQEVELNIFFLQYQRYVSRAHTIFSSFFEIFMAVLFGVFGLVFGLVQIQFIPWNTFYFILTSLLVALILIAVSFAALHYWYDTRIQRENIINKIKYIGKLV